MKTLPILLLTFLTLFPQTGISQNSPPTDREMQNLTAFAKGFGYTKYFHPSDEARQIHWDQFAILGTEKVLTATNDQELIEILESLFLPIAPTVQFTQTKPDSQNFRQNYLSLIGTDTTGLQTVAWQHQGANMTFTGNSVYQSIRTNRKDNAFDIADQLFDQIPEVGESVTEEVTNGIWVHVPLSLYSENQTTLPKADEQLLATLQEELKQIDLDRVSGNDQNVRLANIIITWNELQHFFPYFDVIDTDWNKQLSKSLTSAYRDRSSEEFYGSISKLTAALEDGHGWVLC